VVDDFRKPIAVLTKTVRADPIVVWANQSFCNVHGYEAEEILGMSIMKLSLMLTYPRLAQSIIALVRELQPPKSVSPIFDVLFRHRHKQGRAVMLDCRIQLCYGYDNLVQFMFVSVERWHETQLKDDEWRLQRWETFRHQLLLAGGQDH